MRMTSDEIRRESMKSTCHMTTATKNDHESIDILCEFTFKIDIFVMHKPFHSHMTLMCILCICVQTQNFRSIENCDRQRVSH